MKLEHSLTPYTKINSKWIKDFNVKQESIRIIEENIGSNLFDIGHSNFLQDMSPNAKETSENELLGLHQDQKLLHNKGNSQQNKEEIHKMGHILKWQYRQRANIQDL